MSAAARRPRSSKGHHSAATGSSPPAPSAVRAREVEVIVKSAPPSGKAFRFARCPELGADVFISPALVAMHELAESGTRMRLAVVRGERGWKAIDRAGVQPAQPWEPWQLEAALPETSPQETVQLRFGCFACGAPVLGSADIFKLKGACIWTKGTPASLQPSGERVWNTHKKGFMQNALCAACGHLLGSFYPEPYTRHLDDDKAFPCFKIIYRRERSDDHQMVNHTVLLGDRTETEAELKLFADHPHISVRISAQFHSIVENMRSQRRRSEALAAEARAKDAELEAVRKRSSELDRQLAEAAKKQQSEAHPPVRKALWECRVGAAWQPFDQATTKLLEAARSKFKAAERLGVGGPAGSDASAAHVVEFSARGFPYRVDVARKRQVNLRSGTEREVRRTVVEVPAATASALEQQVGALPSRAPDRKLAAAGDAAVSVYQLEHCGERVSDESTHLARAMLHYQAMTKRDKRASAVELWHNPALQAAFANTQREFAAAGKSAEPIFVFHGTLAANLERIMLEGFKIGGAGVSKINGDTHGTGVYAATGPDTPEAYSRDSTCVILAMALPGMVGQPSARGTDGSDSWRPRSDWIVFRSGAQLLPLYVVRA